MSDNGADRSDHLRRSVARLRSRGGLPMDRWLMIVGAGLVIVGVPVIILGWYGASHTPYVFEQVPYLISGGLLGLALAVVGGLFYFAYWITRQIQETRRQTDQTRAALSEIRDLLADRVIAASSRRRRGPCSTGRIAWSSPAATTCVMSVRTAPAWSRARSASP